MFRYHSIHSFGVMIDNLCHRRVPPKTISPMNLFVLWIFGLGLFVIYYCLFIFFKSQIHDIGFLDKCHTSVFNALIKNVILSLRSVSRKI